MKKLPPHIVEATRLTREGRLEEATALLRDGMVTLGAAKRPASPQHRPAQQSPAAKVRFANLGSAVRALTRTPAAPAAVPAASKSQPADGASFLERSYTCAAGTRSYRLYVPASLKSNTRPALIVMLHGCVQTAEDFAAGARMNEIAEDMGFLVAWPAQSASANSARCWNWFRPDDQRRDAGEPAIIAGITREIIAEWNVDSSRVFAAGLSAGGAEAAILGGAYPDIFAAIGIHSGLVHGAAQDLPSAIGAMRQGARSSAIKAMPERPVRTIVFHGDIDSTVAPVNADQVVAYARAGAELGAMTHQGVSDGGLSYTRTVYSDEAGHAMVEDWRVHGAGHAWFGGSPAGSYTDPRGPDASREMARFFLQQG
jgi:poly(hydroxyalkanoate) depolymerase family esterase